MKNPYFKFALASAAALLAFSPSAVAGAQDRELIVTSPAAVDAWRQEVNRDLDRALLDVSAARQKRPNNAIVEVEFRIDENGDPTRLRVLPGDGSYSARRAAMQAVRRLERLDEAPVPDIHARRFIARIVFYDRPEVRERLVSELEGASTRRLAGGDPSDAPILLGG